MTGGGQLPAPPRRAPPRSPISDAAAICRQPLDALGRACSLPEQFERAARAGFGAVELWWPGDEHAALLPGLTRRWGMQLALLNFDAGDMAAGDRGLAADPARTTQLRQHVPAALRIARACRCPRMNLLVGVAPAALPA